MALEERVKKLAEASGLKEAEIKKLIEKKKEEAAGLLTDHGAIYALEKEYGVAQEETGIEYTKIVSLKKDMSNANVVGVVKEIRPVKKFATEKRSGQFARILLADSSGETNVVLWDKTADIVNSDKIKKGSVLAIRNGYTREGLDKKPEVHVGNLSRILIEPKNIEPAFLKDLPKISDEMKKIGELKENESASTQGRILYLYPKSEFARKDGSKGQRSSVIIEDETGKLRIVLWDSNADLIGNFVEGDVIRVENGQARTGNRGLEVHIGNRSRVMKSDAKLNLPEVAKPKVYKVGEIEPDQESITVSGRVMRTFPVKEFTSGDRTGKLASLIIADETGMVRVVLWGEKTESLKDVNKGDIVLVKNAYTKQNMNGETEVHLSQRGALELNPSGVSMAGVAELLDKNSEEKKIANIQPDDRNVKVIGKIEDVDENPIVFEICSECGARIENVAGEWICDICGETEPAYGMVLSCGVSDGTGDIRAVFYRDMAEELTGMSVPDALNLVGKSGNELEPIKHVRGDIVGKKVTLIGNVRYNDYQDKLELMVSSLSVESVSSAPKKSASKKKEAVPKIPKEALIEEEDIEIEEIKLDD